MADEQRGSGLDRDARHDDDHDTEGHRVPHGDRSIPDGAVGPGEKFLRGDGTPADLHERDTEGHVVVRRPGQGGE